MKLAIVVLTGLGVLAAGSAAVVVRGLKVRPETPVAEILVVQSDLPSAMCLTAEHVRREQVPVSALPRGCLVDPTQAIGRYLIAPLLKGQAVTESSLAARGSLTEKMFMLPPGKTIATLTVPSRSINGGLLRAGCYVHVFATVRESASSEARSTSGTLFTAMQVWSLGDEPGGLTPAGQEQEKAKSQSSSAGTAGTVKVSLLATYVQARILQMVIERGTITLTIRSPRDVEQSGTQTQLVADENLRTALGLVADAPVPTARSHVRHTWHRRIE
jgi:Flp pilus assembly protein CpaB